ncbi:nanos RNA binding domain protein [Dictyocaulus viviparus]|uniref:Nanos RNA binding domain protein n=1 Tax=Dictyocaulus viviparus TaxID=29172 RepID=A0A0D8XPW0_DICVI|nr:nanos RNA binding domain protein [Dictyocaulus viviparus]
MGALTRRSYASIKNLLNEFVVQSQPMLSNQSHHVTGVRFDDTNSSRMTHPPTSVSNHQVASSVANNYSQMAGYYGLGNNGVGTLTVQRTPIPTGYESDLLSQQHPQGHLIQQNMPHYYTSTQNPNANSMQYQQSVNGHLVFNGQPLQESQQQPPQLVNQAPQTLMTVQQRGGGQFVVPVPQPQMVAPQYINQQVMPPAQYPSAGMYVQSTVRPTVFVPRAEMGYAPIESSQPVMVPMPFIFQHAPPNQPSDQQPAYQQSSMEQSHMLVEQFGDSEFVSSVPPVQPMRPMSMPTGMSNGIPQVMSIVQQPGQQSMNESRSATASIPPLVASSSCYGPPQYPRMYGFHPSAIGPPFVMAPHFGVPHMMHSSPGRGRNPRINANSSFRASSTYHNKSKHNNSPQSFSRQSSVVDTPKEETNSADVVAATTAEVEKLSLETEVATNPETDVQKEPEEKVVLEEEKDIETETAQKPESPAHNKMDAKPEVTKELLPLVASKPELEKRTTVPIVAVAPVMSVKAEASPTEEKKSSDDEAPVKENVELHIRDTPSTVPVQTLPTSYTSSSPIELDCTFCRSLGKPEEVATSHVIRGADGKVICPELRKRTCTICGATGDNSHAAVFCPLKSQQQIGDSVGDASKMAHTSQRSPNNYNKPIVFERRGGSGYRGGYGGAGQRGGYNHVSFRLFSNIPKYPTSHWKYGRGGGRYQPRNRHYN